MNRLDRLDDNYNLINHLTVNDFMIYKNIIDDIDSKIQRGIIEFDNEEQKILDIMDEYSYLFIDDD